MHRDKASKHLGVGRIDDSVHSKPCDVPLPDGKLIPDNRDVGKMHYAFFFGSACEVFILNRKRNGLRAFLSECSQALF